MKHPGSSYNRPSLALDLMEEMRPVLVDTTVLRVINTGVIKPRDFVQTEEADAPVEEQWDRDEAEQSGEPPPRRKLLLTREGSKKWFSAYEHRQSEQVYYPPQGRRLTYRQVLREQVYRLARHLKGEEEYASFELRAGGT